MGSKGTRLSASVRSLLMFFFSEKLSGGLVKCYHFRLRRDLNLATRGPFLTSTLAPRGEICPLGGMFTIVGLAPTTNYELQRQRCKKIAAQLIAYRPYVLPQGGANTTVKKNGGANRDVQLF
jgi:hypothetical protein